MLFWKLTPRFPLCNLIDLCSDRLFTVLYFPVRLPRSYTYSTCKGGTISQPYNPQASSLGVGVRRREKWTESLQQRLRNLNSAPSAAVAPRCLRCHIWANQRKPEANFNVTNILNT